MCGCAAWVAPGRRFGGNRFDANIVMASDDPPRAPPNKPGPQLTGQVQPPAPSSSRGSTRSARMNLL